MDAVDAARRLGVDPVGGVDLSGLALTFTEEGEDRGGGMPEPCWVDEATGRMAAHVAVAATDLLAFLAARGRQAREAQSRHARDEDAAARAATFARTQLRLRRLVRCVGGRRHVSQCICGMCCSACATRAPLPRQLPCHRPQGPAGDVAAVPAVLPAAGGARGLPFSGPRGAERARERGPRSADMGVALHRHRLGLQPLKKDTRDSISGR